VICMMMFPHWGGQPSSGAELKPHAGEINAAVYAVVLPRSAGEDVGRAIHACRPGLTRRLRSAATSLRSSLDQKSDLTAVGTAATLPGAIVLFSAQMYSGHPPNGRLYVTLADHGIVNAPLSSTVYWSCKPLPL
jgi:hypothetical protein